MACRLFGVTKHYDDVTIGTMASQITSLTIVYSTVYSGADQRKHQSSASLAFVWGIHRRPVNSPHKGPVTRKMFPLDDVITLVGDELNNKTIILEQKLFLSDMSSCENVDTDAYSGTVSVTASGITCQRWDSQSPHAHSFSHTGDANYCRNPNNGEKWPWCYTIESTLRWHYCRLPNISCCEHWI